MKDYSNYYPSPYQKIKDDSLLLVTRQIEIDSEIYKVDDVEYPLIVEHHMNPLNENKEERKVKCAIDIPIHWGSIVKDLTLNETYIVISDIDIHNNIYKETKIQKCNKSIKWQDETGKVCECPAISKDFSLYTDGIQDNKQITTLDTKINVTIPLNADTLKLDIGKRIIITRRVYEITMSNDFEFTNSDRTAGVIKITMTATEKNSNDNFELGIADYIEPATPSVPSNYTLVGDMTPDTEISVGSYIIYTAKKYNNDVEVTDAQFDFEVIAGDTPSDAYKLTVLNDKECKIECLQYTYYIILKAIDRIDGVGYIEKQIRLKSIF